MPPLLNKLSLRGAVWLASDIHLGPNTPRTQAAFYRFLGQASQHSDALILGGDLFDAWIGDDIALKQPEPWLQEVLRALQHTGQQTQLYLARGNRDFLIGNMLCQRIGAALLPEPVVLDTDFGAILFSHGDEYCTDDKAYQRFRRLVRSPAIQSTFLALSPAWRQRIARFARKRSMAANQTKRSEIMDVNQTTVKEAFEQYPVETMVHGHTHRPAMHEYNLMPAAILRRVVLPDWDYDSTSSPRGGWLQIESKGLVLVDAPNGVHTRSCPKPAM